MDWSPSLDAACSGTALLVYALVCGLDLGVGSLTLIAPRPHDRDAMLTILAPVRYGSSVWLAFEACVLLAMFPLGSSFLVAVWPWLALLFLSLALRGTAYVVRDMMGGAARAIGRTCAAAFGLSSGSAIWSQGMILGAALSGVPATGGIFGFALVMGMICTAALVGAYVFLGAGWLIRSGPGAAGTFGREVGHAAVILTVCAVASACAWAVVVGAPVSSRWSAWPGVAIPLAVSTAVLGLGVWAWHGLWADDASGGKSIGTLARAAAMILVVSAGLTASLWPMATSGTGLHVALQVYDATRLALVHAVLAAAVLITCLLHAIQLSRADPAAGDWASSAGPSHVGRRATALNNNPLHLS